MGSVVESTQRRLEVELGEVCGHLNVLHERLVALMAEALETGAWEHGTGCHSPAHWLAWQTGLSPQRAGQIVAMARRRSELPVTFAAFAAGLLSVDQVAVVARRVPVHNDAEACDLARCATVAQLRVGLSKHFFTAPATDDPPDTVDSGTATVVGEPERVSCGFDDDGGFFLHARTDAVDGAVIERALQEAKDALFTAGNLEVTWVEALVEVCARSLGQVRAPSRRELFRVVVHLDSDGAWVHNGPRLPASVRDRLVCDGVLQPLWTSAGRPINLGRSRRSVPNRTRVVVEDRDRICRHPTCTASAHLEVHHVVHWADGGGTDTANLVCLCGRHHRQHHRGELHIDGNADEPDGLVFRDRNGRVVTGHANPTPPGDRPPPAPAQPYQHPTGERLQLRWLSFRPPPATPAPPHDQN